ncbi:hypothetical protein ENSA5_67540 [Enhygromyxa salina]|uniref:Uncharacterized protein n=2 Tax=Enhygromyxa salina TaxID=215803 RepID=A0A2S9XBB7_9BACT|nr:hypothetical protein ENSA5_67540 [Enhygromyxa salina]
MDKLKPYAVPLVALVITLLWFFVIRPMLDEPGADGANQHDTKAASPAKTE